MARSDRCIAIACSGSGHEEACRPARGQGRSPSTTGHQSLQRGRLLCRANGCPLIHLLQPQNHVRNTPVSRHDGDGSEPLRHKPTMLQTAPTKSASSPRGVGGRDAWRRAARRCSLGLSCRTARAIATMADLTSGRRGGREASPSEGSLPGTTSLWSTFDLQSRFTKP